MNRNFLPLLSLVLSALLSSAAMPLDDDPDDKKAPLKVTSDRMVSNQAEGVIEFTGSVDAVKGSLRVVADKILVFTDDAANDFSHIKAIGSVRITKGGKLATGDEADYLRERNTMILTGSPTLDDGKSVAKGEKVIYNFDTEEMTLIGGAGGEGSSGRATVTLFADDQNQIVMPEEETTPDTDAVATTPASTAAEATEPRRYTVQVAAFRDRDAADAFARRLRAKGYPDLRVIENSSGETTVHRVRSGLFDSREEADILKRRLMEKERIDGLTLYCEDGCD